MSVLAIQPVSFSFHESHDIRIQIIDGEPWFCLRDVCEVLDIKNVSQLAAQLDEKGICKTYTPTKGGKQQLVYVNEPNLYRVIFRSNKPEAKQFQDWVFNDVLPVIRKTGRYERQPASEPLSPNDMANLKHLVWMMTKDMKFEGSWNSGVWYALRSATGRPSPQPFTVDDLPALGEECRRILKITTAFNSAVYDFERDLIRKVIRRREALEPLLREMSNKVMEIQHKESEGLLLLGKFEEHGVKGLVSRA